VRQPGGGFPPPHSHLQSVHDKLGFKNGSARPPDDPARVDAEDEGLIQEAFLRGNLCDFRDPDPIHLRGREVPLHQVLGGSGSLSPAGGSSLPAAHAAQHLA
jgi:hypothetical protein